MNDLLINKRIYISVGLLSASIIAFQLSLMQMLSVIQWNHFAYMIISVALLGFGASGTLLALIKNWLVRHVHPVIIILMLLTGLSMCGVIVFSSKVFGKFDSFLLFVDSSQIFYLLLIYFVFFIPFFLGALAIGLIYFIYVRRIGSLYFADMCGSGTGGLAMLGLLWILAPAQLPAAISFLPLIAGALLIPGSMHRKLFIPIVIIFSLPVTLLTFTPELPLSEYKSISKTLNIPDSRIITERKSPYGLIHVLQCPSLRYAPGLSLSYTGNMPVNDAVFVNGDWFGPVIQWTENDSIHFLDYTTHNLPFVIASPSNVLVPDGGTGFFVSHALSHGAEKVTMAEQNTIAVTLLKTGLADKVDSLFSHPAVSLVNLHSRSYLLSDTSLYDLIILPTIESFGGSSGIHALKENFIFTMEAMMNIWDRTKDSGIISVTTWLDYPVRNPLKILATFCEILELKGVADVEQHIAAIRSWGTISFILKKSPLTEDDIAKVRAFCNQMYFDPLILPGIDTSERSVYNHLQDESFFNYIDRIISQERINFYHEYDFNIRPATDNKPYFFQFLKLKRLNSLKNMYGEGITPYLEIGYFITLFTFIQITLAAIILIILPLFFIGWKGKEKGFTLIYFSGIGLGFMFVEIILIQQFILYFGNPIYAASAVLSGMLICSGTGSLLSAKFKSTVRITQIVFLVVVLFIIIFSFLLTPVLRATINLPFLIKILLSIVIIAPLAFFMGMPFPLGLRYLSYKNKSLIPWAWGVNGCFSVISTVLATIIAVEAGFFLVMIFAGIAYILALGANLLQQSG